MNGTCAFGGTFLHLITISLQEIQGFVIYWQQDGIHRKGPQAAYWESPPECPHSILLLDLDCTIKKARIFRLGQAVCLKPALDYIYGDVDDPGDDPSGPSSKEAAGQAGLHMLLSHDQITEVTKASNVDWTRGDFTCDGGTESPETTLESLGGVDLLHAVEGMSVQGFSWSGMKDWMNSGSLRYYWPFTCLCLQFDLDKVNECKGDACNATSDTSSYEDVQVGGFCMWITVAVGVYTLQSDAIGTKVDAVESTRRNQGEGHSFEEAKQL